MQQIGDATGIPDVVRNLLATFETGGAYTGMPGGVYMAETEGAPAPPPGQQPQPQVAGGAPPAGTPPIGGASPAMPASVRRTLPPMVPGVKPAQQQATGFDGQPGLGAQVSPGSTQQPRQITFPGSGYDKSKSRPDPGQPPP